MYLILIEINTPEGYIYKTTKAKIKDFNYDVEIKERATSGSIYYTINETKRKQKYILQEYKYNYLVTKSMRI